MNPKATFKGRLWDQTDRRILFLLKSSY